MRKYQLCWQPYQVVQSKKVIKSQSVEVPASSIDPPHSYLSCIFLADLSQNISLSVLKVNAVPGPRIHSVNWPNTKPQKTDSYKLQKVHYPTQSLMMQLDVGGKQSMVRPTVATKNVIITPWRRLSRLSLIKYVWWRPGAVMMGRCRRCWSLLGSPAHYPALISCWTPALMALST